MKNLQTSLLILLHYLFTKLFQTQFVLFFGFVDSDADAVVCLFFFTDDEHVGNFLYFSVADFFV